MISQFTKYIFFGSIGASFYLIATWIFLFFGFIFFMANLLSFLITVHISYILQEKYVFKSTFKTLSFVKFFIVQSATFAISYILVDLFIFNNKYMATLFIAGIAAIVSFTIHKLWTFTIDEK